MMVVMSSGVWVGGPPHNRFGVVAQLVEQGTENPCVGGSIPSFSTLYGIVAQG